MLSAWESEDHWSALGRQSLSSPNCPDSGLVPLQCAPGLVRLELLWQGHKVWPSGSAGEGMAETRFRPGYRAAVSQDELGSVVEASPAPLCG